MSTPRFIVNPDTPDAWDIPLHPGANSIGRNEANDFVVEHSSVSSTHCQVNVQGAKVIIKDLGSTCGTFVNATLVEEAVLRPGQTVRLGEVILRFEMEASAETELSSPATAPRMANQFCQSHPGVLARYICPQCQKSFCDLCVNSRMINSQPRKLCRTCGAECTPMLIAGPPTPAVEKPFAVLAGSAFSYPLNGDGLILILGGAIFYLLMDLLAMLSGFLGFFLMAFGTGYLICYAQRILGSSANGEKRMPDWPDFSSFGDVFSPVFQFLGTAALSFAPAIALKLLASPNQPWFPWAMTASVVAGCFYFPMAFTAVTLFDTLEVLNPFVIVPSILKVPFAYTVAVLLLAGVYALSAFGSALLGRLLPVPLLAMSISEFVGLYLLAVEMRILGLLYWSNQSKLGWFRH